MENKKILLIGFHNEKALGVRYLANALTQGGYDPYVVFFKRFNSEIPESATECELGLLRDLIARVDPMMIGMSVMSSLYTETTDRVSAMIRQAFPSTPLVWGGVCATLNPERALLNCDIVLRGEGEKSIILLARALESGEDWRGLQGVAYRNEAGELIQNDVGDIQADIDEYGYPIIGGDNMFFITGDKITEGDPQLKAFSYELSASRGCPFQCTYCSAINLRRVYEGKDGRYVRFRSVDSVMAELNEAKAKIPRLRVIHFWDEIFSTEENWVKEFTERYKKEIGIPFRIWGHPLMAGEDLYSMLVDAGLHQTVMGIQSGSPSVRKDTFHRYESQEQILQASRVLQKCKVPVVYYDLMICHPFESVEQLKETFDLCLQLAPPFKLSIHGLNFLPKTDIVQMAIDRGLYTQEELDKIMFSSLQEQYDRYWGPHASSFKDASKKNSWTSLIFLTQFPEIRAKVMELAKDPEGNAEQIAALKAKMSRKQRLMNLWDKVKLVLKIGN